MLSWLYQTNFLLFKSKVFKKYDDGGYGNNQLHSYELVKHIQIE